MTRVYASVGNRIATAVAAVAMGRIAIFKGEMRTVVAEQARYVVQAALSGKWSIRRGSEYLLIGAITTQEFAERLENLLNQADEAKQPRRARDGGPACTGSKPTRFEDMDLCDDTSCPRHSDEEDACNSVAG